MMIQRQSANENEISFYASYPNIAKDHASYLEYEKRDNNLIQRSNGFFSPIVVSDRQRV